MSEQMTLVSSGPNHNAVHDANDGVEIKKDDTKRVLLTARF